MLPRWGGWGLRSGGAVADDHLAAVIRVAIRMEFQRSLSYNDDGVHMLLWRYQERFKLYEKVVLNPTDSGGHQAQVSIEESG